MSSTEKLRLWWVRPVTMLEPLPKTTAPLDLIAQLRHQVEPAMGAGNWNAVRELLAENCATLDSCGELTALYGEALLRTGRSQAAREWLSHAVLNLETRGERVALRRRSPSKSCNPPTPRV